MVNKKIFPVLAILLVLTSLGFVFYFNFAQVSFGDTIFKPQWGSLGCIKDDSPQTVFKYLDQQTLFKCGDGELVDDCTFTMKNERGAGFLSIGYCYKVCDLNGQNCKSETCQGWSAWASGPDYTKTIEAGQSLQFSKLRQPKWLTVTQKYYPYRLWTEVGGGHWLSRSADCSLADQNEIDKGDVKYGDWITLSKTGSNKYKNYVIDWVPTYGSKIYTYQNTKVICGNNILYKLDKITMANGQTANIQGNTIKGVQCCPHQTANCDSSTFEFLPEDEPEERECTYDYECEHGGIAWAISDSKALQEKCSNDGECIRTALTIECGSDAKCRELYGSNHVCDLTIANFGTCIESGLVPQAYCGDGYCQTGETSENCLVDCVLPPIPEKKCGFGQHPVIKNEIVKSWYNYIGIGTPEVIPYDDCIADDWVIYSIFGAFATIIILASLVIFSTKNPRKKTKSRNKRR